jgi:hypothetical protein
MAGTDPEHRGQDRYPTGVLAPSRLPTHLGCAPAQVGRAFPLAWFHRPPSWARPHHLSRRPLVPLGHQDLRLFRADIAPFFPPPHRDVAAGPQTEAGALHPAGFPALPAREAGPPDARSICARHMGHQGFAGFRLARVPWPSHRTHQAPAPRGSIRTALAHPRPMLLGARGGLPPHQHPLGPRRGHQGLHQRTAPRLCRAGRRRGWGPHQATGDGETIALTRGEQPRAAPPPAAARFGAPCGRRDAVSPAWLAHAPPPQDPGGRPWAVARGGRLPGPTTLSAEGDAKRPP